MYGSMTGLAVAVLAGAVPCILLGYLIAVKQKRGLIAGWDESRISRPVAYAQLVGYSLLVLGFLIGALSIIGYLGLLGPNIFALSLLVASSIPIVCVVVANRKYRVNGG